MIQILEISNTLGLGGTEKTMQIFCKYLDKKAFTVYACGFLAGGIREKLIRERVTDCIIANGNPSRVIEYIQKKKIKILHWHSIPTKGSAKQEALKILQYCKSNNIRIIETAPFTYYDKLVEKYIDKKLFVSRTSLVKYLWKYPQCKKNKEKYGYVYNPVDLDLLYKYKLSTDARQELRGKYGIVPEDFVIGKIGRATLWKWDDMIIDIVPKLVKRIPTLKVVVREVPTQKLKKIHSLGIDKYFVLFKESVDEKTIMQTFQMMDVVVHTCRIGESFGVVLAEGMYYGKPVVTDSTDFMQYTLFDRDNAQCEVVRDGINGFVETTPDGFIDKIVDLYRDKVLYARIARQNKKDVSSFDAVTLTKKLEKYFLNEKISEENYDEYMHQYIESVKKS